MADKEAAKSSYGGRKGVITRRINELSNAMKCDAHPTELREKIRKLKEAMENLGIVFDNYVVLLDAESEKEVIDTTETSYYEYDYRANCVISNANKVIYSREVITEEKSDITETEKKPDVNIKLEKLKLPVFRSCAKSYFRWKSTFERYVKHLDDQSNYDYLISHTNGKAHEYVANNNNYKEAISILYEKFGNKHLILRLVLDDIRQLQFVKRGDFVAFENLSFKRRNFKDRLVEMGLESEVESSYILQEMESKLNDDLQRWFESLDSAVDTRKVADFVTWLDKQTHIRQLTHLANYTSNDSYRRNPISAGTNGQQKSDGRFDLNTITDNFTGAVNCQLCKSNHNHLTECSVFPILPFNEKWNTVKDMRICFICLKSGQRRTECIEQKCEVCAGPHHKLLHNPRRLPEQLINQSSINTEAPEYSSGTIGICNANASLKSKKGLPNRSLLLIVQINVKNADEHIRCKALLDSGSELNVRSTVGIFTHRKRLESQLNRSYNIEIPLVNPSFI